jgi:hypothetical protein
MADAAAPTLRRVAVFFDERVLAHDTGAGCFELLPSPLLEVHCSVARRACAMDAC